MGISNYDISGILGTAVSQRLVRRLCQNCAKERDFTDEEKQTMERIGEKYNYKFNLSGKHTFDAVGCTKCNGTGYFERIGVYEVLPITDKIREVIAKDGSSLEVRAVAMEEGYKPLVIDGINKVLEGYTTLDEIRKKIVL